MRSYRSLLVTVLGFVGSFGFVSLFAAQAPGPPEDFTRTDLSQLGIAPVTPAKDPKTGFVVGGKNTTSTIERLSEIVGRSIAALEIDMRPGAVSEVGSDKGFLGDDESLLKVLADDNRYVVDELGLTHQELAKHLQVLAAVGTRLEGREFRYHGVRFKVSMVYSRGYQFSPFRDGTKTNAYAVVENVLSGKTLEYSLLVPHMVERYGFYEGKGTPYRVEPSRIVEVLDFLKKPSKDSPQGVPKAER
ncbi:MAG: hypothetical protein JJ992_22095 [Planctomycetes bacterium]|nr:hypothetical protein [Planctomycetota bacterium]